ncbi:MAG: energy transducer TonB family protein [Bdellovibrionales bacterium]
MIRKYKKPVVAFLLLSLLVHFGLFISFIFSKTTPPPPRPTQVEVEFVEPPPEPQKQVRVKAPPVQSTDQIVEQKDKINEEVDPNTRFLSQNNQKVIKQTKAERSGKFKNTALGGKPDEGKVDGDKKEKKVSEEEKVKPKEKGELPDLKDLSPKFSLSPGPKAPDSEKNGDPSQSDDYLKDVNTGMQTLLSTREFVYYSYYARIKEAIRQHWEPNVREKVKIIYRQGRNIASAKDRVTQVLVTLNDKGELIKVEVLTQSGVEQLDNAAVEAFKAASPFPNPPKGMVEPDGTIKIRWDFVLEA